ncbi:GPI inositol-deacylase [Discoglossus pictus]
MGGLVARALLTLKNFKPERINLIITQATPHVAPVLPVDSYLTDFYALVNNYWILNARELQNITMLSVAGGHRDYQVPSGLTFLPQSNLQKSALSVVSSAVPRTWASTDHLSIVWCRELIIATVRALFDLIDGNTKQITKDQQKVHTVLNYHFVRHPAKWFDSINETSLNVPESSTWVTVDASNWNYAVNNESTETLFMFPISHKRDLYTHFHCQNTFMYTDSWIFGCNDTVSPKCLQIEDLSWKTELLSTAKVVYFKLDDYPEFSHFIISIPTTNGSKFSVECEFSLESLMTVQTPVPHSLSFGLVSNRIHFIFPGLHHIVQFQEFEKIYQAFNIRITKYCAESSERKSIMYRFHVPWSHEDIIRISSDETPVEISAKLHAAKPENDNGTVQLMIYTSADCNHEVTISTSFPQVLGQILRFHASSLPVYILSNLLLAYGAQLRFLLNQGNCVAFDLTLVEAAKPYKVEPIINILRSLLGYSWFKLTWDALLLPQLDSVQLYSMGLLFPMASLVLFMFGTSISYWCGIFFEATLRPLSALWIALKRPTDFPKESRLIHHKLLVEVLILALISWWTCSAFALLLVFFCYLLKVIKLYTVLRKYNFGKVPNTNHDAKEENSYSEENNINTAASEDQPSEGRQSEDKPSEGSQSEDKPSEGSQSEDKPSEGSQSEDKPSEGSQSEDKPSEGSQSDAQKQTSSITNQPSYSDINAASDSLKMHITIMNLLIWVTLLTLPSFVYWLKNLRYNIKLDPDPHRYVVLILIFILEILMNSSISSIKSSKLLKKASQLQLLFSILVVAFGTLHLYRASYFVTVSLFLHVLCCFL